MAVSRVYQKNPRVRSKTCFARNSGARNGCANFMGAWKKLHPFSRQTALPIKFFVLGGGGLFWVFGGGGADCIFMGAKIFPGSIPGFPRKSPGKLQEKSS